MSTYFYAMHEHRSIAFGARVKAMLAGADAAAWRTLFDALSHLHPRPDLMVDGRFLVDPHPRTNFSWHLSPKDGRPVLSQDAVPGPGSELSWLLACALLQASDLRLELSSIDLNYAFSDIIPDRGYAVDEAEVAAVAAVAEAFFGGTCELPEELEFLATAVPGIGYASRDRVSSIAAAASPASLLSVANRFRARGDINESELGDDIVRLAYFTQLAAASNRAIVMSFGGV